MSANSLLFPGQGAQVVGMGRDLAEAFVSARRAFETASRQTGIALDRISFEGPLEELSRSNVAQPAILTASIAALRAMAEAAGRPGRQAGAAVYAPVFSSSSTCSALALTVLR